MSGPRQCLPLHCGLQYDVPLEAPSMRSFPVRLLAAILVFAAPAVACAQTQYTFTRVASTASGSGFSALFPPSLNQTGVASFGATLTGSGGGVFAGNGGSLTTIAQIGTTFSAFNNPPLAAIAPNSINTAFY